MNKSIRFVSSFLLNLSLDIFEGILVVVQAVIGLILYFIYFSLPLPLFNHLLRPVKLLNSLAELAFNILRFFSFLKNPQKALSVAQMFLAPDEGKSILAAGVLGVVLAPAEEALVGACFEFELFVQSLPVVEGNNNVHDERFFFIR